VGPLAAKRRSRTLLVATLGAALAGLVFAPAALADWLTPESGGSPNADSIDTLYKLVFYLGIVVFIGVEATLAYFLIRYRARKGQVAAQIHGNTRLEIGWTVGAAVILIFITAFTFIQLPGIKNPAASQIDENGQPVAGGQTLYAATDQAEAPTGSTAMNIRIDGQQYAWRFQYPGRERVFDYEELTVPAGMTITLDITSSDVAHSWWIPKLGGKADALPGYVNKTWFKVPLENLEGRDEVVYTGQCAELCGRNHANMGARVRVLRFDDWKAWYDRKAQAIQAANRSGARQRAELDREQQRAAEATAGEESSN